MSRTAEKIGALVREDASMESALETIRETADENGGEVEWADVREDITSGQWGRIIEKGLLVDGEEGFSIADREAFDEALDEDHESETEIDAEASKWSQYDKMAAVASVALMVGYWFDSVRDTVGGAVDVLFAPLEAALPFYAVILVVALLTGLYSTLLQAILANPEVMAMYQERMKSMQEKRKDVQRRKKEAEERDASEAELEALEDELQAVQEEQMEAMAENMGMFKEQLRPMVWIMLFTIPLFLWMYWQIHDTALGSEQVVFPLIGIVEWSDGFLGPIPVWILWYFLCSLGFTQLLRKALDIDMTPTG